MADSFLGYQEPTVVDERLDAESLTVNATTVLRERIRIAGAGPTDLAPVDPSFGLSVDIKGPGLTSLQSIDDLVLAEDVASADGDKGVQVLAVRKASPTNLSGTDGDYEPLQVNAGRLWTSTTIDTALPAGTNSIGKLGANPGVIIGDVNVVSAIPGTGATNLGKAEDAASASGDTGVMTLAVRSATPGNTSGTDGDYEPLQVSGGKLWTNAEGQVASGATDVGNPVKVGGRYNNSPPTLTDGQRGDAQLDVNANVKVTQATLLAGEDIPNNVLGVLSKPIASSSYSPSRYTELTQVTKANIKASTGNVVSIFCSNINAAVRYFQIHNKATAPVATDVPAYSFPIAAGSSTVPTILKLGTEFFTDAGVNFSAGIGWAISTTYATFTDSATNTEHVAVVNYV